MERSETITELAAAMAAAQPAFAEAVKSKINPHLKSKYADLGAVWDAAKEALSKNGLSVVQLSVPSEPGQIALETVLLHKSGQYMSGIMTMPFPKPDPQGYGAAMTYARRYALSAILGICADDDDDGHAASAAPKKAAQLAPAPPANGTDPEAARKRGANAHFAWQNEHGLDDKAAQSVCSAALGRHVESRKTLTADEWGRVNAYCKSLKPDYIEGLKVASVA